MKISYSILTHNETTTLEKLLKFLIKYKQPQDEIVILDDYSDNEKTKAILDDYSKKLSDIRNGFMKYLNLSD